MVSLIQYVNLLVLQVKNLSRRLAQLQAQLQAAVLDDFKILMGQVGHMGLYI